jgi:hypothetical protein
MRRKCAALCHNRFFHDVEYHYDTMLEKNCRRRHFGDFFLINAFFYPFLWYRTRSVSSFSFFLWVYTQLVGFIGRVIGPSQGLYLNTGQHQHRINTHTPNIHTQNGIRTHDHSVRVSEDSSCLRPRGYCDRLAFERAKTVHASDRSATVTG